MLSGPPRWRSSLHIVIAGEILDPNGGLEVDIAVNKVYFEYEEAEPSRPRQPMAK
jgi:hypothetical protein